MNTKAFFSIILFTLFSLVGFSQAEPPSDYTGDWITKYSNGQTNFKGKYVKGKAEGEGVYYFPNGQIRFKGTYLNGLKDGKWVAYFDNGNMRYKVTFKNGDQVGERIYF